LNATRRSPISNRLYQVRDTDTWRHTPTLHLFYRSQVAAHADEIVAALECHAPGAQQAAASVAAAAGIKVCDTGDSWRPKADSGDAAPPSAQLQPPTASTPSLLANTSCGTPNPIPTAAVASVSQQQQQQQQQIGTAQVHARLALLTAASLALPAAQAAQVCCVCGCGFLGSVRY
jgi:hypothetical protein